VSAITETAVKANLRVLFEIRSFEIFEND